MPKRILFAWETGTNYGHAAKIAAVTQALSGCEVVIAARDVSAVRQFCGELPITLLPAPLPPDLSHIPPGWSYAHNLQKIGYCDAGILGALYESWRALFDLISPDVIVTQSAPTALLASNGLGVPVVNIGTGFDIPPPVSPLPPFLFWSGERRDEAEAGERAVLGVINDMFAAQCRPRLDAMADAWAADQTILATVPELDHYDASMREASEVDYVGALISRQVGAAMGWTRDIPRLFAYLRGGTASTDALLSVLGALSGTCEIILSFPGLAPEKAAPLQARGVRWIDGPVRLDGLLDEASLCLSPGVPQVTLPTQIEQVMLSRALAESSAGLALGPNSPEAALRSVIRKALDHAPLKTAAARLSKRHAGNQPEAVAARIAQRIQGSS